jgi:chromosome segregation ATPase
MKSRLSSLQANKQYFLGRTNTLSVDIDNQDRQEENLHKQINDFNNLIRDKEGYIKQLLSELNGIKEQKETFGSELTVLQHKEDFLVNELIFKEEQLNDVVMNNEEMRRKISSGQS